MIDPRIVIHGVDLLDSKGQPCFVVGVPDPLPLTVVCEGRVYLRFLRDGDRYREVSAHFVRQDDATRTDA